MHPKFLAISCLSIILLPALIISCEKHTDQYTETIAFGKIVDWETNLPLPGISIMYVEDCDAFVYNSTLITQTDVNGEFEVKYLLDNYPNTEDECHDYLETNTPGYSPHRIVTNRGGISEDNIRLVRNGFLNVHIKNIAPYDISDHVSYGVSGNDGWSSPYGFEFPYANNLDTILVINIRPNDTHTVHWNTTKNGISNYDSESIFFQSGDTLFRTLFF